MTDSAERFTGRVDAYEKYRPGYPLQALDFLRTARGLLPSHVVADMGSGTGRLTGLFLDNGNTTFAVEPNREMRAAAERRFAGRAEFRSVDGRAEACGLPGRSVDVVAAGQAFHWFRPAAARDEFRRILRPGGFVVLAWNVRDEASSPFLAAYEAFLAEHSVEYNAVSHRRLTEGGALGDFFVGKHETGIFANPRRSDFAALWGGYLSASYSLPAEHPRYGQAREALHTLFDRYQEGGSVSMPLRTEVYVGGI